MGMGGEKGPLKSEKNARFESAKMRTFAGTNFLEFHIYETFAE